MLLKLGKLHKTLFFNININIMTIEWIYKTLLIIFNNIISLCLLLLIWHHNYIHTKYVSLKVLCIIFEDKLKLPLFRIYFKGKLTLYFLPNFLWTEIHNKLAWIKKNRQKSTPKMEGQKHKRVTKNIFKHILKTKFYSCDKVN